MATPPIPDVAKDKTAALSSDAATDDQLGPKWFFWRRQRYILALLAFFGFINLYTLRINLSVAIVAMTNPRNRSLTNGTIVHEKADFDWDSKTQGLLHSAFFYGYMASQLPGGWVVNRIGGTKMFGAGILGTTLLTLITPPLANVSVALLVAVRIMEGLLEGVVMPSVINVWSYWAPPLERSRLATFAISGCNIGTVIVLPVSGIIASYIGWPAIFYVFGGIGLLWWIVWWLLVTDSPALDPRISASERKYIQDSLGNRDQEKIISHPWFQILTSVPYMASVVAHFAGNWGFYTLVTQLPTFMKDTLAFNIKDAGFVSALPYFVMAILLQISGHIADGLQRVNVLSVTNIRKTFLCSAFVLQASALLLATWLTNVAGVVACLTLGVALGAFAYAAFCVNPLDLAPRHVGVLTGFSNTVANLSGIISPQLTGFIVQNKSAAEWRVVFYITSTLYLAGAVVYGLFASGEKQPWAEEEPKVYYINRAMEEQDSV